MKADEKKCPRCAETIKFDAKVCRHCGHEFSQAELAAAKKQRDAGQVVGGLGCLGLIAIIGFCAYSNRQDPAVTAAKTAEDQRKGFHCLSAWDGSHPGVVAQVKAQLRDPSSFEHSETRITPVGADREHILQMTYRAKNGFGGLNVDRAMARISNATCAATLISASTEN